MRRRQFIAGVGSAAIVSPLWRLAAQAQQSNRVMRVAVLLSNAESDPVAQSWNEAFLQGLRSLGWADGRNMQVDVRWAGGDVDRLANMAQELIDLHPDVVLAVTTPAANAILRLTRSIPVVFTQVTDPVAQGLVASLAHPGGNITGFAILEPTIGGKWFQVLKEIALETVSATVIFNPATAPYYGLYLDSIKAAAQVSAVEIFEAPVHSRTEIEAIVTALARKPGSGIISMSDTFTGVHRDLIIELAARYKLPAAYGFRSFTADGGLFSYGIDLGDQHRRAALYVDRILKGAKPSELPIQLPTKFEFVINLKTAKALGLTIPLTLLGRADEVIE